MNLTPTTVLLETSTVSRLYGTATPDSDHDKWVVVLGPRRTRQTFRGDHDITTMDLATFTQMVNQGVPQALEALWSPVKTTHQAYRAYFNALRPNLWEARMRHLVMHRNKQAGNKGAGHAVRTARNLQQLLATGRYNPECPDSLKEEVAAARSGTLNHETVQDEARQQLPPRH